MGAPCGLTSVTYMRINNLHMPGGAKFSISGFRIFGLGEDGAAPAEVLAESTEVVRDADEGCTIKGERPAADDAYRYFVEYCTATSAANCDWERVEALDRSSNTKDMPHDYVELPLPLTSVTYMRINNLHMPGGAKFSISGFRIFGLGEDGAAPAEVLAESTEVVRDAEDARHVTITWPQADGAELYVVRYGIASNYYSLYHNVQVYATTVDIRTLVVGEDYEL